jgi:hypothetical protein
LFFTKFVGLVDEQRRLDCFDVTEGPVMLLDSSERGVRYCSRIMTLVLPQRLVGETSTMNGEISPESIVGVQYPQRQGNVGTGRQDDVVAEYLPKRIEELRAINRQRRGLDLPMRQGCGIVVS